MPSITISDDEKIEIDGNKTAGEAIKEICQTKHLNCDTNCLNQLALWVECKIESNYKHKEPTDSDEIKLQLVDHLRINDVREKIIQNYSNYPNKLEIEFRLGRNNSLNIKEEEKIEDENILEILFLDAKNNVVNNYYPLKRAIRAKLSRIECEIRNRKSKGDDENSFEDIFRQYTENLPETPWTKIRNLMEISKKFKNQSPDISSTIDANGEETDSVSSGSANSLTTKSLSELYREYLDICRKHAEQCYGGVIFKGQIERTLLEAVRHRCYYDKSVAVIIMPNNQDLHIVNLECSVR